MPTLDWSGKKQVLTHHRDVPLRRLNAEYTFGADASENKIIKGDNLEALKALLPEYEGKIKCIYIDPPYNTGNEKWIYNDNVNDPKIKKWLGQVVGKEAEDLSRHDKWLCMMYPRLKLLHKLLAPDGAIFVSIDDNEQANLKLVMDEVFGGGNYLGLITRKQSSGSKNDTGNSKIITTADYIVCYKKKHFEFYPFQTENKKKFSYSDEIGDFSIRALEMQGGDDTLPKRSKMGYSIYYNKITNDLKTFFDYDLNNIEKVYNDADKTLLNEGYKCYRPRKRGNDLGRWRWGLDTFIERFEKNLVYFDDKRVYMKERANDFVNKYPEALIEDFLNTQGTNELKEIFTNKTFDFPKPSNLIKFLCSVATKDTDLILDSFAGSGTTAHAVLNLNKADNGNRKFILVEMEDYAETITAERVRRVIAGYGNTAGTDGDFGFYTLGEPYFLANGFLNESVGVAALREYVWYSEGARTRVTNDAARPYYLGEHNDTAFYFYYDAATITELNYTTIQAFSASENGQAVVYADSCALSPAQLAAEGIIFKIIPREIKKM